MRWPRSHSLPRASSRSDPSVGRVGPRTLPLVSILTPSFNQARYLRDCVASVRVQTYERIEHVVMDGGSADGSVELLERSARVGLRWQTEKDRGQAHALNKAFSESRGAIIGWLNSDDAYADRRAVAWAVEAFARCPFVDVVFGHALLVNEENTVLHVMWAPPFSHRLFRSVNFVVQPTVFVRRSAIEREGVFVNEQYDAVFDRDLFLRLSKWASFRHVQQVVAIDRHQRARKVETLSYRREAARYDLEHGLSGARLGRAAAKTAKVAFRTAGAVRVARLPEVIDPALDLVFPPTHVLMAAQLTRRRAQMPFGED